MALNAALVKAHIADWENRLGSSFRPYRNKWPSRLFHHAPLENAVKILQDGHLRSRLDPKNRRDLDVAAIGVIDSRTDAHKFARLYFRPRTPTQWHIEGIRKSTECQYTHSAHAPILIMLVFDAKKILGLEGVNFSDRNMQLSGAAIGNTEEYFKSIPFEKVYHEGNIGGDRSIIEHRCAEVLVPSPLSLSDTMQWIICRTVAEKETLIHFLGEYSEILEKKILVSPDIEVFQKKHTFVEEVHLHHGGLKFQLNPREDLLQIQVSIRVTKEDHGQVINFSSAKMPARPNYPILKWKIERALTNGSYIVEIKLENCMAYCSRIVLNEELIL